MYSASGALRPRPPFDFAQSSAFLEEFAPAQADQTLTARSLTKATCIGNQALVFRVESTGTTRAPRIRYRLYAARPLMKTTVAAAADRITFYLSLEDDLRPFYAIGNRDQRFSPIIERLRGYHQVKFLTPFENACWAILSQHNYFPIARRMKDALVHRYGASLTVDGVLYRAFPAPARIARTGEAVLAEVIRNARRARYLVAAARAFDKVDDRFLRTAAYDEVEAWLRAIPGIGAWSAAFVLIRSLGRMERIAFTEKALGRAVSQVYGRGRPMSRGAIARIVGRYGPWQGYWAHYLRAATSGSVRR